MKLDKEVALTSLSGMVMQEKPCYVFRDSMGGLGKEGPIPLVANLSK